MFSSERLGVRSNSASASRTARVLVFPAMELGNLIQNSFDSSGPSSSCPPRSRARSGSEATP